MSNRGFLYANLTNPQTLNLYSMVADDPESSADLDGHNLMGVISSSAAMVTVNGTEERACIYGGPNLYDPVAQDIHELALAAEAEWWAQKNSQKQPSSPVRVIRTGKHVYKKPHKMPDGTYFVGTVYSYKVVDAKDNVVRGPIDVLENLTPTPQTRKLPRAGRWDNITNGQFKDAVGYDAATPGSFPKNYFNVVDQTFVVTQNGVSTLLGTTVQQTVSSDSNGNVTGVAHTLVP